MLDRRDPAVPDYELQQVIAGLLSDHPGWRRYLAEMVHWEETHPGGDQYSGWGWEDVQTPPSVINSLITLGVVRSVYRSRSSRLYRLDGLDDTHQAILIDDPRPSQPEASPVDVSDLFSQIVGLERHKALLTYALTAESPIHCLLWGPPGSAKTLMISDIGRMGGAEFYVGSTTTKSGLVGLLLQQRPKYLVIDELDKMAAPDAAPLLNLLESGIVTRLQHGHQDRIQVDTRVFAAANDLGRIRPEILSRFAKLEFPAYTPDEFVQVAALVLQRREGLGPELSKLVAHEVVKHSTDVRDAVRVARMVRQDPRRVVDVVACLWPPTRGPRLIPIRS